MNRTSLNIIALILALACLGVGCADDRPEPSQAKRVVVEPVAHTPPALRPTGPIPAGTGCVSSGCHGSFETSRFVHGVLRGTDSCLICHEQDQGGHVYPVKLEGQAGCTHCHESVVGDRLHQHGAVDGQVGCTACHDPHVSEHGSLLRAPVASLCAACHPSDAMAHPHGPYGSGECTACHNPHESDFSGLLRGGEGEAHCYMCHEETERAMTSATSVHAPAGQDCRICHQPHGSDHPAILKQEVGEMCLGCHSDVEEVIDGAMAPHPALVLKDQCANCHDAHVSSLPALLKDRQDVLCLQCHGEAIEASDGRTIPDMTASVRDRKFLHGPVKSGNCTACHNVHGASHSRLLVENFTDSFYSSFDLKQYALCFECHENDLVTAERTTALTDFRDGDLNLHYVHVHREQKGRTCRTCHEMHGSDLPGHIAETVPFEGSNWALPIGFRKTDTGGSCSPGCHKPMSYSRVEVLPGELSDQGATP